MGHYSISVTVDVYGHLVPGAEVAYVDKLDLASETAIGNKLASGRKPDANAAL